MDNLNDTPVTEKYYVTAVIFTVLALYSMSVYSYFENPNAATAHAVYTENLNPDVELTNTLTVTGQGKDQIFQPINTDNTAYVPGAPCTLTDHNLTPVGTFHMLPADCSFVTKED